MKNLITNQSFYKSKLFPLFHEPNFLKEHIYVKVGLSPSKKLLIICFNDSPSKMIKNGFYFILKGLFVLKTFWESRKNGLIKA